MSQVILARGERALARLARKAFLTLWSYPNVYTDESRKGTGDGKELVDLLVVFGDNVLLFSDKHCEFRTDTDVRVSWQRWYKRAIFKSSRQLAGAESFLRRFPTRIFVDKECQTRLPVTLPHPAKARFFLIAVTRGCHQAAARYFGGGSSGSMMLNSLLVGDAHHDLPFQVGFPLGGRFVHVLDELTLDALLEELDTVPDLVAYLQCKEAFFTSGGVFIQVAGEEELLAQYMGTMENGKHALPKVPTGADSVLLLEGDWEFYKTSRQRAAKREADAGSYMWDSLIEYQASFVRAGTAVGLPQVPLENIDHERILRAFAAESRLSHRELAAHLRHALSQNELGKKFARMVLSSDSRSRAYVFLTVPKPEGLAYEEYRELRSATLLTYCHGIKLRFPFVKEAIGIASEPFSEAMSSQDFLYVELAEDMSEDEQADWRKAMEEIDVLQTPTAEVKLYGTKSNEFPIPFEFGGPKFYDYPTGTPMNRAERRRMLRDAQKKTRDLRKRRR